MTSAAIDVEKGQATTTNNEQSTIDSASQTASTAAVTAASEKLGRHDDDDAAPSSDGGNDEHDHEHDLRQTVTTRTTRSVAEALRALENFDTAPENARNWSNRTKWATVTTVALTAFVSTCGSTMAVPGIPYAMRDFGTTNEKVGILIAGCYVLGMGTGPFLFAPMSELYGRQPAYMLSQTLFVIFCMAASLAPNMPGLIILRFLCGCFGSVGPTLGVATCADMFIPQERGRPVSLYAIGPMMGPPLGSMFGYWIVFGGWRWLHWAITILGGVNWILLNFFARETFAPAIQKKFTYRVRNPPPADAGPLRRWLNDFKWMGAMVSADQAKTAFSSAFSRPPRLLFMNPVASISSVYYAYIFSILYLFVVALNKLFGRAPYNDPKLFSYLWPQATVGLSYTGMALGFFAAAMTAALYQDKIYKYMSKRNGDNGRPEYRLLLTQVGITLMPIGLFIFGWTAHAEVHWIAPMIGQVILSYGTMLAFNTLQAFLVDAFFPYSAAAVAGAVFVRSALACIISVFAPQMFSVMGWGWGGTFLGLVAATGIPLPTIMFKYGQRLRERFKFKG
ncbi:hypothetical protein VHUM_03028 [Vanrija humicola]|uniref:Major facilitator superfamily (MFS) profile domain-containing protein n=1 Tax=Vanrija humicola TaxID=5417 RepID=A0A7D8YZ96_VANHU|nr:hypothetical protein VHUM_03028 [Vanrija humicola]